jgi:hypothetical protein
MSICVISKRRVTATRVSRRRIDVAMTVQFLNDAGVQPAYPFFELSDASDSGLSVAGVPRRHPKQIGSPYPFFYPRWKNRVQLIIQRDKRASS